MVVPQRFYTCAQSERDRTLEHSKSRGGRNNRLCRQAEKKKKKKARTGAYMLGIVRPLLHLPQQHQPQRSQNLLLSSPRPAMLSSSCTLQRSQPSVQSTHSPFSRFKSNLTPAVVRVISSLNLCFNFSTSAINRSFSLFISAKSFRSRSWISLFRRAKSTWRAEQRRTERRRWKLGRTEAQ